MLQKLSYKSKHKSEMIQITSDVKELVIKSGIKEGIATIFTPHTTASVLFFENNDPNLLRDFLKKMSELIPLDAKYAHIGDNAHAHIKSGLCGASITVLIEDANIILGKWQGIYLIDFDGPRQRDIFVKIVG